ncbi:MAG TPA: tetratricopeptide repeat protein [Opitutaceae bacterium]|nr:tetratricopeptide repeat protein [Opitutaceae bacterium]
MASPPIRAAGPTIHRVFLGAVVALPGLLALAAAPPSTTARKYYRDASSAVEDKNYEAALGLLEKAAALRPDHPRYLGALARLQALNERPFDAIATLSRMARLGVFLDPEQNEDFAPLHGYADFADVIQRLRANREPMGAGQVLFELPAMTGIIEGVAYRAATGDYFLGDARHHCVWIRRPDGAVQRFSPAAAGLLGVFGLAVDEPRVSLWAATSAVPEMEGYGRGDRNRAALVEFALADGAIRRVATVPADGAGHVVGDLAVAANGTVYATDSIAPVIWRLPPGAQQLERWVESDQFQSLQGIASAPDGGALLVSDYDNGMFLIETPTRSIRLLAAPPETTLVGIDGIAAAPDGSVVAVQNGTEPRRVVRLWLDAAGRAVTRVAVLERGHPAMADPTLGTLVGDRFVFVGNAGWDRFAAGGPPDASAPRAVPILVTRLAPPARGP